ncbi:hypothetical protein DFH28DRAFT_841996, partial [Melampsora americana]
MRQLDEHIKLLAKISGSTKLKLRRRLRPTKPKESIFKKAPKGLPIDFYNVDWFNNTLSISQRSHMADIDNICFLPNVELSLLGKAHPDERLKDKAFTKKHWDSCAKDYNLDFLTADGGTDEEDDTDDGEADSSIDLVDSDEEEEEGKDEDEEDETEFEDED